MRLLALLVLVLLASACASPPLAPRPTLGQKSDAAMRFYPDLGRDEFFAAVEEVFRLADGDDFEFTYNETGKMLTAERYWFVFLVLAGGSGTDTWTVVGLEEDNGISGLVTAETVSTISDGSIYGTKQNSGRILTIAAANLFWDRVDFVLGRRDSWPTCDDREAELEPLKNDETVHGEYWFIRPLCHISMKDIDPRTGEATNDDSNEAQEPQ